MHNEWERRAPTKEGEKRGDSPKRFRGIQQTGPAHTTIQGSSGTPLTYNEVIRLRGGMWKLGVQTRREEEGRVNVAPDRSSPRCAINPNLATRQRCKTHVLVPVLHGRVSILAGWTTAGLFYRAVHSTTYSGCTIIYGRIYSIYKYTRLGEK